MAVTTAIGSATDIRLRYFEGAFFDPSASEIGRQRNSAVGFSYSPDLPI